MATKELDLFADNNIEEAVPEIQEPTPSVVMEEEVRPEEPEEPGEPEQPESPEMPEQPEAPELQESSEQPEVMEIPEEPVVLDSQPEQVPVPAPQGSVSALFRTFFKIGIVTFGGGYAMIPLIESEVVDKKKWVEKPQFLDLIAVAQTCPGVFAINISTFIGYKLRRTPGALLAALGAAMPSFLIILAIAMLFRQFQDIAWVEACFKGIRPAVVALIAVPTFNLAKSAKIGWSTCWIPIVGALLIWLFAVNPIWVIIGAALLGYLYGTLLNN